MIHLSHYFINLNYRRRPIEVLDPNTTRANVDAIKDVGKKLLHRMYLLSSVHSVNQIY
jgi:hypothetical protein